MRKILLPLFLLALAGSLAIYMINDKDRTITKMPMNDVAGAVTIAYPS